MLGLPSTTRIKVRISKENLYRNIKVTGKQKRLIIDQVSLVTLENSISEREANVEAGKKINQIFLISIRPKNQDMSEMVYRIIGNSFPDTKRVVFINTSNKEIVVLYKGALFKNADMSALKIEGSNLDEVWDSFLAQIVFNDINGTNIETRIANSQLINGLEKEIEKLDEQCRKAKQIARKNELFDEAQSKRKQLIALKGDTSWKR